MISSLSQWDEVNHVRMPKWVSTLAVIDGIVFILTYILRGVHYFAASLPLGILYWTTVWAGLVMAVFGFFPLTRGTEKELRRSVICILFSLLPACVGLVAVLGHIGTPVGHAHV